MRRFSLMFLLLVLSTLSCNNPGVYFVPPFATPTMLPEVAILMAAPDQAQLSTQVATQVEDTPLTLETTVPLNPPPTAAPTPEDFVSPILYYAQAADTLPAVAVRFGVAVEEIQSPDPLPAQALLTPGQLLIIPPRFANTTASQHILPDSELVYSPSASDFDIEMYITQAGGYLSRYKQWLQSTGTVTGAQVVKRVSLENSINPRLLLALLEYQSGWVYGNPAGSEKELYPMGYISLRDKGLYRQLVWAVNELSNGYYHWREGRLYELEFVKDGYRVRLAPDLNAGSVALQYYFAQLYPTARWLEAVDMGVGFPALYEQMFGSPWQRAVAVEPLYPPGLTQPPLILPFQIGRIWAYTGGPHGAWESEGSYAALDFAPSSAEPGCVDSNAWTTAMAAGLVVRSGNGVVVLDLDGDGKEQTGWVLLYLHVSQESGVPVGTWVERGDPLGHPSCEGGHATGTHVHIARKYNGEWIAADGPIPFTMSWWVAHSNGVAYSGDLTRGDERVIACTVSTRETWIQLDSYEP